MGRPHVKCTSCRLTGLRAKLTSLPLWLFALLAGLCRPVCVAEKRGQVLTRKEVVEGIVGEERGREREREREGGGGRGGGLARREGGGRGGRGRGGGQ